MNKRTMKQFNTLNTDDLTTVIGGKNGVVKLPGGTGVYCWNTGKNSAKCALNWSETGPYVGKVIVHNFNLYREV